MNREQAAKLLPILQAWTEGKEIQYSVETNKWEVYTGDQLPNITSPVLEWRIKPEVKEGWIVIDEDGGGKMYTCRQTGIASWATAQVKITYTEGEGL